jgi:hypothetical protein
MSKDYVDGGTTQNGYEPKRTYTDVELLEISQVSVPSNRDALVTMRSKGIDPIADEIANEILNNKAPVIAKDKYTTEEEAEERAQEIGCVGSHSMDEDGNTIYMPCSTHDEYDEIVNAGSEEDSDGYGDEETKGSIDKKTYTVLLTETEKADLLKAINIINATEKTEKRKAEYNVADIMMNAFKTLKTNKNNEV